VNDDDIDNYDHDDRLMTYACSRPSKRNLNRPSLRQKSCHNMTSSVSL